MSQIPFKTSKIEKDNLSLGLSTLRREKYKGDGSLPKCEFKGVDLTEDLSRRDFTINSIYADLEGNLFDPHNGFKDLKNGYQKVGTDQSYVYDSTSFFPRMWSDQKVSGYERWREAHGNKTNSKISFKENLHFFFDYQIGWSYMRYFMWNFAGRQNDIQSMDQNDIYGNWESGLSYAFSAEKEEMPSHLKNNIGLKYDLSLIHI